METVISDKDREKLSKAYYEDGMCFGRDGLFQYLKNTYKDDHPTKRTTQEWLNRQKLQQEFRGTRKGGLTDFFRPKAPFHSISIDLIDFNNKPAQSNRRYILVVVDNFSRKMYTKAITSKEPVKTAPAMEQILKDLKAENKWDKLPIKYIISDDGSEWKADFDKMLKSYNLERRRTLGGQPQQNGLCERANGKVKMLIAKNMKIHGGSWFDNMDRSVNAYNNQYNRMTKFNPTQALQLDTIEEQKQLIDNVTNIHKEKFEDNIVPTNLYKVGDKIRVKLNKGTLGKQSTPSWSSVIYTVGKVIKSKHPTIADKYKVKELAQDQIYSRADLQLIEGPIEEIPVKPKKKRQTEQLSLTDGAFSIEAEKQTQRERRERKQTEQFDFNVAGLNDKTKRSLAKKAKETVVAKEKQSTKKATTKLKADTLPKQSKTVNVTADSKRKGKQLF